jgi:hypothetical protein
VNWLAETHGRHFELVRHFLRRMFDGEWSSSPGQWKSAAIGLASMLLPGGLLLIREGSLSPQYSSKYRWLETAGNIEALRAAAVADELALVTLAMCIIGILALLQWQSLFPGKRDYLALASLPVRPREIFTARFVSVLLFSMVIVLCVNLLPSLIAPIEFGGGWRLDSWFLSQAAAEFETLAAACFFVFFAIVGLQGVLLNLVPGRAVHRISSYAQGALTALFLLGGLYSWSMKDWRPETIAKLPAFGASLPPAWFTGLHETLLGHASPFYVAMAARGRFAVAAVAAISVLTYLAVYRRHRQLILESPASANAARSRALSLARILGRTPQQEAILDFLAKTLARSRTHYLLWLVYLGAAAAVVLNSSLIDGAIFLKSKGDWNKALHFLVFFWPLACSVVMISGFRHVLSIPSELPANWVFRITENLGRKDWMKAVERFIVARAIAPIYAVMIPVSTYILGWETAARLAILQIFASLSIFELLFNGWQKLPFTCSHTPGNRPLVATVGIYFAALCVIVPIIAVMVATASAVWFLFPVYFLNLGGIWFWLHRIRRDGWGDARLIYDDAPGAVVDLGIRDVTYSTSRAQIIAPESSPTPS